MVRMSEIDRSTCTQCFRNGWFMVGLWYLTPLSTIFQLCRGDQFYLWKKPEYPEKTTDLSQVTRKLDHIIDYTSPWARCEITTLVVIGTDCTGSCKPNYHTTTTTTAPEIFIIVIYSYGHIKPYQILTIMCIVYALWLTCWQRFFNYLFFRSFEL